MTETDTSSAPCRNDPSQDAGSVGEAAEIYAATLIGSRSFRLLPKQGDITVLGSAWEPTGPLGKPALDISPSEEAAIILVVKGRNPQLNIRFCDWDSVEQVPEDVIWLMLGPIKMKAKGSEVPVATRGLSTTIVLKLREGRWEAVATKGDVNT